VASLGLCCDVVVVVVGLWQWRGQVACGCGMAGLCPGIAGLCCGMTRLCWAWPGCAGHDQAVLGMTKICRGIAGLCRGTTVSTAQPSWHDEAVSSHERWTIALLGCVGHGWAVSWHHQSVSWHGWAVLWHDLAVLGM